MPTHAASTPTAWGDDFNSPTTDASRWGPDLEVEPGGQFVPTGGRLQFTGSGALARPWIGSYGSDTQDWELTLEVSLGHMALTEDGAEPGHWVGLAVAALDGAVLPNGTSGTSLDFGLGLRRLSGQTTRAFGARMYANGALAAESYAPTTNQQARLRVTFTAATRTLTAWYAAGAGTNAQPWTALAAHPIDVPPIDWELTSRSAFRFALVTVCEDYSVSTADHVSMDNFAIVDSMPAPPDLALVPAGWFEMGTEDASGLPYGSIESPEHELYVSAFWADRFEVTNEQMCRVLQWAFDAGKVTANPSSVANLEGESHALLELNDPDCRIGFANGTFFVKNDLENFPCAEVTWYGAQAYCNFRSLMEGLAPCIDFTNWTCDFGATGYRLPTEAEWEKAARGGLDDEHHFPWPSEGGSYTDHIDGTKANYLDSGDPYGAGDADNALSVAPVGYYDGFQVVTNHAGQLLPGTDMANGYGLYDMAGNLYEWCWDWADVFWYSQPGATVDDTTGPPAASTNLIGAVARVMRGGSWEEPPVELRCASRAFNEPDDTGNGVGFRCVRPARFTPAIVPFAFTIANGAVIITGYTGPGGVVTVPSAINGMPVIGLGDEAFCGSLSVTSIAIPASIGSISEDDVFSECPNLMAIVVDAANPHFTSAEGVLFDKSKTTLIAYPGGRAGSYTVPASVTNIGNAAFGFCRGLTAIAVDPLNAHLSSLDGVLFDRNQTALIAYPGGKVGSYTTPATVAHVKDRAFGGSANLTGITFGDAVVRIGAEACEDCSSLTEVAFGRAVASIGDEAFRGCSSLVGAYFQGNAPSLDEDEVFDGCNQTTVYHLPGTTGWNVTFGGLATDLWPAPTIIESPVSCAVVEGGTVSFKVTATVTPLSSYVWTKNGLPLGDDARVSGTGTDTLTIESVHWADVGGYSVVISNPAGSVASVPAPLTVLPLAAVGGTVVAWGDNSYGQRKVPAGVSNVVAVSAGETHSLALRADGTVVAWTYNPSGETDVPAGLTNAVAVAGGDNFSLALRADGTVAAWGDNYWGQTNVPAGLSNVVAIAAWARATHALALRADGTVVAWGDPYSQATKVPAGLSNVVAVAAGSTHSLALRVDGTVAAWGGQDGMATNVPAGLSNVVAVAAGSYYSLALRADGTMVAWGGGSYSAPAHASNVVAIAIGLNHALAVRADGTVVGWGENPYGQTSVPAGLTNAVEVAGGALHSLALALPVGGPSQPVIFRQPEGCTTTLGETIVLRASAIGRLPLIYQWQKDGVELVDGGNVLGAGTATLRLLDVTLADSGRYSVVIRNPFGKSFSGGAVLTVQDIGIASHPVSLACSAGDSALFSVTAAGASPFGYQWWKDGTAVAGATNPNLTLTDLDGSEAGTYWVMVSNAFGAVSSRAAVLTMRPSLDTAFAPEPGGSNPGVYALAIQTDGKILVGGTFSTLAGAPRAGIGRLNADGTLDARFDPAGDYACQEVYALTVQADGKILVGGSFSALGGQPRRAIARLNPDGTCDTTFNPVGGVGDWGSVAAIVTQPNGQILVGGSFDTLAGQTRHCIGRLNADGTPDTRFDPSANDVVHCFALQPDGEILVGGRFNQLGGQVRYHIGRLHANGTVDTEFDPTAYGDVNSIVVQADGEILLGGHFYSVAGQTRDYLARLHADGTLDPEFNPGTWSGFMQNVHSLALQTDGKILVGGWFSELGGQSRNCLGRLNPEGTLDAGFDLEAGDGMGATVHCLAVQADGKILVAGKFSSLGRQTRQHLGRLDNTEAATSEFTHTGSTLTWRRTGTAPEVWRTAFEYSIDGTDWVVLGSGSRLPDGWELAGASVPPSCTLRARGDVAGGANNWIVASATQVLSQAPFIPTGLVSQTVAAGDAVCFSVEAMGLPPLVYQWRKDGATLANGGRISGATSSNLCLFPVEAGDAGGYWVIVTNNYGSVTSSVATLTVMVRDDFAGANPNPNTWGPDIRFGAGGQLVQTNGHLQFLGDAPVLRPWIGSYGSYTQDWEVIADVNLGNVALTQNASHVQCFLVVANHHDTVIQNGWPGDNFSVALDLYRDSFGASERSFEAYLRTNWTEIKPRAGWDTTAQSASLRITFDSTSKTLTAWYDADGGANGHAWTALRSAGIASPASHWEMTDNSAFRFALGVGCGGYSVAAEDAVYADAFLVSGGVQLGAPLFDDPGNFAWARRVANSSLLSDELALGVAVDAATNVYVAGWFDGANDFGGTTLTSYGGQDAFVAKYNASGALQWVRQAGAANAQPVDAEYWDHARGVGVDAAGNVYVTGGFLGQAKFDWDTRTSLNTQDFFLAKYDSAGNLLWVRQGSDSEDCAYGTGIAVAADGTSLVVGYFDSDSMTFDGVTATNPSVHHTAFLAKYDRDGTIQWATGLGGGRAYSTTVGMDAAGNGYVGGGFEGTLELGTPALTSGGDENGFLAKFDRDGRLQWVRQVAGPMLDGGRLGVDASGNCYHVSCAGTGVVDFVGQNTTITNDHPAILLVARYDTSGALEWVQQAVGTGAFVFNEGGCAIDRAGNCHVPGILHGSADFGGAVIANRGGWDAFVAKYDASGDFQWVQTAGGTLDDGAFRLALDAGGTPYVAGWFQWIPAFGAQLLQAQGYRDVFLAKLGEPAIPLQFSMPFVAQGVCHARLDGPVGATVIVDASADLVHWTPVQTNTLPAGGLPLAIPVGAVSPRLFQARIP